MVLKLGKKPCSYFFFLKKKYNGRVNLEAQEFWISDLGKSRNPEYKRNDQRVPSEMTKSGGEKK